VAGAAARCVDRSGQARARGDWSRSRRCAAPRRPRGAMATAKSAFLQKFQVCCAESNRRAGSARVGAARGHSGRAAPGRRGGAAQRLPRRLAVRERYSGPDACLPPRQSKISVVGKDGSHAKVGEVSVRVRARAHAQMRGWVGVLRACASARMRACMRASTILPTPRAQDQRLRRRCLMRVHVCEYANACMQPGQVTRPAPDQRAAPIDPDKPWRTAAPPPRCWMLYLL